MILTILALGGTILAGTTIAGLLVVYQIRQTTDLANSAKAIFAADSGIEWGLYQYFQCSQSSPPPECNSANPTSHVNPPVFSNGANVTVTITCYDQANNQVLCTDPTVFSIRSLGKSGAVSRALEQTF